MGPITLITQSIVYSQNNLQRLHSELRWLRTRGPDELVKAGVPVQEVTRVQEQTQKAIVINDLALHIGRYALHDFCASNEPMAA